MHILENIYVQRLFLPKNYFLISIISDLEIVFMKILFEQIYSLFCIKNVSTQLPFLTKKYFTQIIFWPKVIIDWVSLLQLIWLPRVQCILLLFLMSLCAFHELLFPCLQLTARSYLCPSELHLFLLDLIQPKSDEHLNPLVRGQCLRHTPL